MNAYLCIDPSGLVTFVSPKVEMGQDTYTSLSMLIAEELEVDLDQIRVEDALGIMLPKRMRRDAEIPADAASA